MTLNITPDSASGVPVKAVGPPTTLRDIRKGVSLYFEHDGRRAVSHLLISVSILATFSRAERWVVYVRPRD